MGLTSKSFKPRISLEIETSWDDGSSHDLQIADLLTKYGIKGTFYICLDNVDKEGFLTWAEIKDLSEKDLFDIGSHTMTHPMDLKKVHDEQLEVELQTSKDLIENAIGRGVSKFCYPRGRYDDRVLRMVANAGYNEARTTLVGHLTVEDKLQKHTTVHVFDGRKEYRDKPWLKYAKEQFDKALFRGGRENGIVFHLWGHSAEVAKFNQFHNLDKFFRHIREHNV